MSALNDSLTRSRERAGVRAGAGEGFKTLLLALDSKLTNLALNTACILLAVICVLGLWQVVSRFVLSQPSTWTEESMRRLLIWCVMLGVVVAFRRGALVSVDLMLRVSKGMWRHMVRTIITVVSLAFLAVLLWYGIDLAWRVRFQTFASIDLSMAWAYAALPVGAALAIVGVLAQHVDPMNEELETAQ
jgi:TRAP-type C4-dicarboxylate transport system permease small subunit